MGRIFTLLLLCFLIFKCADNSNLKPSNALELALEKVNIPQDSVDVEDIYFNKNTSEFTLENKLFSGYVISRFSDNSLKSVFGVFEGKKQNTALDFYEDGSLKYSIDYHNGRIHGEKKSWSIDTPHILVSELNYNKGKLHGLQKQWYATGEIFKILNFEMGKESGMQKAFRKNGDLFANYEAKKGRIFGLKKTALCFELDDENIVN